MKLLFAALLFASLNASAYDPYLECKESANLLVESKLGKDFKLTEFISLTPGSYHQEYAGIYQNSQTGETMEVTFYSPFICDDLEISRVDQK